MIPAVAACRNARREAGVFVLGRRLALCLAAALFAAPAHAGGDDLLAKYAGLRSQLANNPFHKPLVLDSRESAEDVAGDIHALVDHPFAAVAASLSTPGDWCDILILHVNTKYCRASGGAQGDVLNVSIGRKFDQPLDEAHRVVFGHRVAARSADYLHVELGAAEGPLSTREYRIVFEAVPVDGGRTFIRLSYSYAFGLAGRLAMQAYLATIGSGKVGFTVAGTQADGQPRYIGGMRGVVERNTMRYYLAIEAFLGALSVPPQARLEKRLSDWYAAAERFPRQLHEMERDEYLRMKRREYLRQQSGVVPRFA